MLVTPVFCDNPSSHWERPLENAIANYRPITLLWFVDPIACRCQENWPMIFGVKVNVSYNCIQNWATLIGCPRFRDFSKKNSSYFPYLFFPYLPWKPSYKRVSIFFWFGWFSWFRRSENYAPVGSGGSNICSRWFIGSGGLNMCSHWFSWFTWFRWFTWFGWFTWFMWFRWFSRYIKLAYLVQLVHLVQVVH